MGGVFSLAKFYIPLRDMQVPVQNGKIKSDQ